MNLREMLTFWIDRDAEKMSIVRIDPAHVDRSLNPQKLEAGRHYIRMRLADMYLKKQVAWFSEWYPAVHSLVRLDFGDQPQEIPNVADASRVAMVKSDGGDVVARNFMLTPTLPFNGGTVALEAGLVAIPGQNYLNTFLQVLSTFAGLLAVPQLSAALNLAQPVATGLQNLLAFQGSHLHLGLHDAFSAGEIQECYIAVIRAPEGQVQASRLWVVSDQLREGDGVIAADTVPFEQFDHIVLRIEVFEERDDWDGLSTIQQPFQDAITALGNGNEDQARFYLRQAQIRAMRAPELTRADRRRVVTALAEQFEQSRADLGMAGLVGAGQVTVQTALRYAMPVDQALELGEPRVTELFEE